MSDCLESIFESKKFFVHCFKFCLSELDLFIKLLEIVIRCLWEEVLIDKIDLALSILFGCQDRLFSEFIQYLLCLHNLDPTLKVVDEILDREGPILLLHVLSDPGESFRIIHHHLDNFFLLLDIACSHL
jgi:hypothetical protein